VSAPTCARCHHAYAPHSGRTSACTACPSSAAQCPGWRQPTPGARRRITYPTRYTLGPLRLVTLRRQSGYAIADAAGIVATRAHPVSGRMIPALFPTAREALSRAAIIIEDRA
jgi:hypothetical protein